MKFHKNAKHVHIRSVDVYSNEVSKYLRANLTFAFKTFGAVVD